MVFSLYYKLLKECDTRHNEMYIRSICTRQKDLVQLSSSYIYLYPASLTLNSMQLVWRVLLDKLSVYTWVCCCFILYTCWFPYTFAIRTCRNIFSIEDGIIQLELQFYFKYINLLYFNVFFTINLLSQTIYKKTCFWL